jgi:hypothetical protein
MIIIDLGLNWDFYAEINSTEQQIHHKTELRKAILASLRYKRFCSMLWSRKKYKSRTFSGCCNVQKTRNEMVFRCPS